MAFFEHNSRSIVKALTFRCIILISDFVIIFTVTRRYDITFGLMILSNFSSTILYFFHERIWNKIHWGKKIN